MRCRSSDSKALFRDGHHRTNAVPTLGSKCVGRSKRVVGRWTAIGPQRNMNLPRQRVAPLGGDSSPPWRQAVIFGLATQTDSCDRRLDPPSSDRRTGAWHKLSPTCARRSCKISTLLELVEVPRPADCRIANLFGSEQGQPLDSDLPHKRATALRARLLARADEVVE